MSKWRLGLIVASTVAAAVGSVLLPEWSWILILLALMFVVGWLSPEHPVAAATVLTGVMVLPCVVVLDARAAFWFTGYGYNLRSFDLVPAYLLVVADFAVNIVVTWGWMVFSAYMGAGIALRLRKRAAAA